MAKIVEVTVATQMALAALRRIARTTGEHPLHRTDGQTCACPKCIATDVLEQINGMVTHG